MVRGRLKRPLPGKFFPLLIPAVIVFFLCATSCKEPVVKSTGRKNTNTRNIEQVSSNIERITAEELVPSSEKPQTVSTQSNALYIPLMDELQNHSQPLSLNENNRNILSQFPSQNQSQIIKVTFGLRGISKSETDSVENRILNLLGSHAPEPWVLKRSQAIDKNEQIWGHLHVDLSRSVVRLRKTSKNAPLRAKYGFDFNLSLSGDKSLTNSWDGWKLQFHDEVPVVNESAVDFRFWKDLEQSFPLLTVMQPEDTERWLRAQGLNPQIIRDGLSGIKLPSHQYYPNGCILSNHSQSGAVDSRELKSLYAPYTPPQTLSVVPVVLSCTRESTFLVSAESTSRLALYYQPVGAAHAWKSLLTFEDAVKSGDMDLHIDDEVVCLYTGNPAGQTRSLEIQCLDRKTGIMQWKTSHFPGARRGFAYDENQLVFVNDQAIISFSRQGKILDFQSIQTVGKPRDGFSCQLQNRLIFMSAPGQFVSWNLDSREIDWQNTALSPSFIHCSQQNTFLYSDVGGYILAFDVEKKQPLWKYKLSSPPRDAITYGDVIYLLSDRAVIALDRSSGHVRAQLPLPWMAKHFIMLNTHIYLDTEDAIYTWK